MDTPTHLDYPALGHTTRLAESEASNAAWDAVASQIGTDEVHDTALYDFPSDLIRVSRNEYRVLSYHYPDVTQKQPTRIVRLSNGWGVL